MVWQMIYTFVPVLGVMGNFAMVGGAMAWDLAWFSLRFGLKKLLLVRKSGQCQVTKAIFHPNL